MHSLGLLEDGFVLTWSFNSHGQTKVPKAEIYRHKWWWFPFIRFIRRWVPSSYKQQYLKQIKNMEGEKVKKEEQRSYCATFHTMS